ncbi:MAG TPA: type II toxin-antitoxin system VapC family toxin [Pirellulales bacterium]|nr:type II toxin-antitoxin system VapC family toxin [Pirellulales bacterium]
MSKVVLDASALLALLFGEPGCEIVASRGNGAILSSVGYSETLAKMIDRSFELADAERIIGRLSLRIAAFDSEAAALAASFRRHTKQFGLSFADRACLALGLKTGFPVLTADQRWAEVPGQVKVELIR